MPLETTPHLVLIRSGSGEIADEGLRELQQNTADGLERIVTRTKDALGRDRNSGHLTREGFQARRAAAMEAARKEIMERMDEALGRLRTAREQNASILSEAWRTRPPADADPAEWRAALREVRDRTEGMSEHEVNALYIRAARAGDRVTVAALETAPPSFRLVSDEAIEEGAPLFAAAAAPDTWATLQEQDDTISTLEFNTKRALAGLGWEAGEALAIVQEGGTPPEAA